VYAFGAIESVLPLRLSAPTPLEASLAFVALSPASASQRIELTFYHHARHRSPRGPAFQRSRLPSTVANGSRTPNASPRRVGTGSRRYSLF
jgi:hypothetical protein